MIRGKTIELDLTKGGIRGNENKTYVTGEMETQNSVAWTILIHQLLIR